MKSAMKYIVVFLIIMVTFGLPVLLQQVINPRSPATQVSPTPTEVESIDDIRFISVPPVLVPAGSTFMYKVLATSLSGNEVTLTAIAKPDWMTWTPETQLLMGQIPDVGGVFTVTVRAATIAGDVEDQTFTVTIDKEEDVKGAKTVGMWKDPFHPNVYELQPTVKPGLPDVTASEETATSVLGEKTQAKATALLTEQQQTYLLAALGILLLIVIISIVSRILKTAISTRSKLPPGIIIERGGK